MNKRARLRKRRKLVNNNYGDIFFKVYDARCEIGNRHKWKDIVETVNSLAECRNSLQTIGLDFEIKTRH